MLFPLLALPALSLAAVISQRAAVCSDPPVRKEWRKLSTDERAGYVKAVQCLATKPSRINLTTTLYDDFAYVHDKLNNEIHFVASFLPWHRYFVQVYEDALHDCGYNGSATYWDWSLDSSDPASSAIWDAKTGIGGNGNQSHTEYVFGSNMRCVTDGPFSSLRPAYLGSRWAQHCLGRNFNNGTYSVGDMLGYAYTPAEVKRIGEMPDYNRFRNSLEGGPHGAVHSAIGGDMSPSTSPNDPVFFLHHTQIDRLWYLWQQEDPEARYTDYSGIKTQDQFDGTIPPPSSIDDVLPMLGLADDLTVKDVMSTTVGPFCYSY